MSFHKLKKLIWIGQLWINLPILLLSLGVPMLILRFEPLSTFYWTVLLAVLSFFLSIGVGWLYWSIMITKWRIWAFSKIPESDYPTLKKRAIAAHLIWPDHASRFTKTEIRSQQEKVKLEIIEEKIQTQQELGQLTTILNTGDQVIYPMSRKKVFWESFGQIVYAASCICLCFTQYYPLSIIALVFWIIDYQNIFLFFRLGQAPVRFEINQQGIYAPLVRKQTILWESIYSYTLGKDSKLLFLVIEENGNKKKIKIRLWPYDIPDYDLLEQQLEIFIERFLHRWEQRSVEDN